MNHMATEKSGSCLNIHEFSSRLTDTHVYFQVLRMKDSFHLWVGTDTSLGSTAVAVNTPYEKMPISSQLLGDNTDQAAASMAQRLAKKTGKQVFVSCNIKSDQILMPLVEKRISEELVNHPEYF